MNKISNTKNVTGEKMSILFNRLAIILLSEMVWSAYRFPQIVEDMMRIGNDIYFPSCQASNKKKQA